MYHLHGLKNEGEKYVIIEFMFVNKIMKIDATLCRCLYFDYNYLVYIRTTITYA